jgi:hypothetical protein
VGPGSVARSLEKKTQFGLRLRFRIERQQPFRLRCSLQPLIGCDEHKVDTVGTAFGRKIEGEP